MRVASAELLDALGEDEWVREGTHSESGRYTMNDWLETTPPTRTITPRRCSGAQRSS